jgi:Family of unknown function (DUF6212)
MSPAHPISDLRNVRSDPVVTGPVVTDPATAAAAYNGEFKVLCAAADLPAIAGGLRLPAHIALYGCARATRNGVFEIFRAGVRRGAVRVPLNHPPTFCLTLLAASEVGKSELDQLRRVWSGGGEGFLPGPTLVNLADAPDVGALTAHRLLLEAVARTAGASTARLLVLQRQYAAFRTVHDHLQNAFDTVENFLARSHLPPSWLAFACEPTETTVGPRDADAPFRLTQLLPVASQGLAAIELHAAAGAPGADGALTVGIATCEDGRMLGEWEIPYPAVPDGWMFLDLPEIDIMPRQSAVLTVIWSTRSGRPPQLSLTALQPVPESRVGGAGAEESRRSLALRLHIGLPGSRRVAHPFHIGVMRQPHVSRLGRRLAPSVLRRFAEIDGAPDREPLVSFVEDAAAIELRPVNGGVTVAKLPSALPPTARRLTATIKTEDPAGPLVEYALLALDPRASHKPILIDGQLDGQPGGFSGWLPIYPDFAAQIHVTLAEPAIKPLDLYLATRLAAGQAAQHAQARWLEFVVDGFHETAI